MPHIEPIAEGLNYHEYPIRMAWGLARFGAKSLIFKAEDNAVGIISPGPIKGDMATALTTLGPVKYLIAPNCYHHIFLAAAARQFPEAIVYVPPYLAKKIAKIPSKHTVLESGATYPWSSALDHHLLDGMPKMNEFLFLHRESRTLIATDFIFNISTYETALTRLAFQLMGAYKPMSTCCRLFRSYISNKTAFAGSVKAISKWNYDRVVVSHGDIIESDEVPHVNRSIDQLIAEYT